MEDYGLGVQELSSVDDLHESSFGVGTVAEAPSLSDFDFLPQNLRCNHNIKVMAFLEYSLQIETKPSEGS